MRKDKNIRDGAGTINRRTFLKVAGSATLVGSVALTGTASASEWRYKFVSEALDAKTRELVIRENQWAFTANGSAMSVVDISNPELPVLVTTVTASGDDNNDVSVSGDIAGLANDGSTSSETNPAGVTFFDISDPTEPVERAFYDDVESGVHNHYVHDGYAYICENASGETSFSKSRIHIVDVSDPADPVSVGSWRLQNHHPDMALSGLNPAHDVFVQGDLAYVAWWDAGCIVLDVSDPAAPREVAHFGATEKAGEAPEDTAEFYRRYLGNPGNAHYARPSPNGDWTFVGDETYPGTYKDVVIPGGHGGIRIFDTGDVSTGSEPSNPTEEHVGFIPAPDEPQAAPLRTSHNFEPTDSKVHTSWYQGGVRLWDVEDPTDPQELAAWISPDGQAYWGAKHLVDDGNHYTVGSERDGKGLTVLDIVHETGSPGGADDWPDLGPEDVLGPTMQKPL